MNFVVGVTEIIDIMDRGSSTFLTVFLELRSGTTETAIAPTPLMGVSGTMGGGPGRDLDVMHGNEFLLEEGAILEHFVQEHLF